MKVNFHMDLEKYSLKKFRKSLKSRKMIPSRVSLKENIDERFNILEKFSILNNQQLIDTLKTKEKIVEFSKLSGLPTDYLILLNREAKSFLPNPCRLDKFSGIEKKYFAILEEHNIKNTRQFFNLANNELARIQLAHSTNIPISILEELFGLSDLSRVYGVGPVFARMIYDLGVHSIKSFLTYSGEEFIEIYEEKTHKKADFSIHDIDFSLELAKELDIEFE